MAIFSDIAPGRGSLLKKRDQQRRWCGAGNEWPFVEVEGLELFLKLRNRRHHRVTCRVIQFGRGGVWVQANGKWQS
jgi:hypothetical protein